METEENKCTKEWKSLLSYKDEEISYLRLRIARLETEISTQNYKLKDFDKFQKDMVSYQELIRTHESVKNENAQLKKVVNEWNIWFNQYKGAYSDPGENIKNLTITNEGLNQQVFELMEKISRLSDENNVLKEDKSSLINDYNNLEEKLKMTLDIEQHSRTGQSFENQYWESDIFEDEPSKKLKRNISAFEDFKENYARQYDYVLKILCEDSRTVSFSMNCYDKSQNARNERDFSMTKKDFALSKIVFGSVWNVLKSHIDEKLNRCNVQGQLESSYKYIGKVSDREWILFYMCEVEQKDDRSRIIPNIWIVTDKEKETWKIFDMESRSKSKRQGYLSIKTGSGKGILKRKKFADRLALQALYNFSVNVWRPSDLSYYENYLQENIEFD